MTGGRGKWPWVTVLAAVALAGGIDARLPVLIHMAYLLLALLVLAHLYALLSLRLLRIERRASTTRLFVGERLLEVYQVESRAFWPVFTVGVAARSGVSPARPLWNLALAPRGREELTHVAEAPARGRYPVGAIAVSVCEPFGIAVARRLLPPVEHVVVWPRARIVPDFSLSAARAGDLLPARRSWARMPVAGAVRPFAQGDSSTRIHWLSSMRHGLLMVKDSDQSVGQRLWVALDLQSPAHAGLGEESTVEYGVEAAAYVAELAYKAGLDVGLVVAGADTMIVEPRRGRDQREHLLDVLAAAQPGGAADLAATLEDHRLIYPSDAIVALTPLVTPRLLELLGRWRRLGCGVVAVLLDASGFGGDTRPDREVLEAERIPAYIVTRSGT